MQNTLYEFAERSVNVHIILESMDKTRLFKILIVKILFQLLTGRPMTRAFRHEPHLIAVSGTRLWKNAAAQLYSIIKFFLFFSDFRRKRFEVFR